MHLVLCSDGGPFDFQSDCVRNSWGALLPAGFVVTLIVAKQISLPERVRTLFQPFLPLSEAEVLEAQAVAGENVTEDASMGFYGGEAELAKVPLWRSVVLSWISMSEALVWLGIGSYRFIESEYTTWSGVQALLLALSWLYAATKPMIRPTATPPFDLFSLFILHLIGAVIILGGVLSDHRVYGVPLPSTLVLSALVINLATIVVQLTIVLKMPLSVPSSFVKKEEIGVSVSLENYTSLFGWITFSWVYPMVSKGRYSTLNEKDVWQLSPTMQARPLYIKFSKVQGVSLLWRLWKANSFDLILDFVITFISVVFNYTSPFFLKQILDAVADPTPENKNRAYIYASLAFLCSLLKSQADVQHLWVGRRAATRIRSELMASIYDKALKRKDFSGIIDKDKQKEAADKRAAAATRADPKVQSGNAKMAKEKAKEDKARAEKADDPKAGADVGKIVNLMAGDANRVAMTVSAMYFLYGAPFEIIIACFFLYQLLGLSAFAGFLVLVIGWPLNSYVSRRSIRIQKGLLAARDKRMSVLNELVSSVKFIKFFAWEEKWIQRTLDAREVEMNWMIKVRINSILFSLIWNSAPILVSVIAFFVYVIRGNQLTVSVAFTSIALFNMVRMPLNIVPTWIVQILQTGVALNRIATYLDEDEVTEQVSTLKKDRSNPGYDDEEGLGIENGSFKWNEIEERQEGKAAVKGKSSSQATLAENDDPIPDSSSVVGTEQKFELSNINVKFPESRLSVITGPTASGKTALLMALLGELTLLPGGRIIMSKNPSKIDEHGLSHTISYAAQTPWLRHQSIRDNILFGSPYDEERYKAVIEACALGPDLDQLEDGDTTEIGARGVSLSGGQKARVALARAAYAHTKYVLLDDPLSAVDSHTSRLLFEKLLCGPLLANRTVILVTHHVELVLPGAYYLVRMLDGRIDTQGTIEDLRAMGVLESITQNSTVQVTQKEVEAVEQPKSAAEQAVKGGEEGKKPRKLIKDEYREQGGVKWSIYKTYLEASSYWTWGILFILILLNQVLGVTEKLWIKTWGDAYGRNQMNTVFAFKSFLMPEHELPLDAAHFAPTSHSVIHSWTSTQNGFLGIKWPDANKNPLFYVSIYAGIGLASSLGSILSSIVQYTGALRASRLLFKQLLVTVVRATMRWHDTTPQGRMLNRFGKDIETIDSSLAGSLQAVNSSLAMFFASILTVGFIFPLFLVPATIIGFVYRELAIGYLNSGRDLRRMESNTRSPIFQGFSELLEGIVTVRAFSAERRFLNNLYQNVDLTSQMWYMFWMTNRWLLLNFDALGATAVLVTTLFALSIDDAGLAGVCITSAMAFTSSIYWACRFWTALELDLNSVERVVEYLELPQEPPAVIESNRPPAYWPSSSNLDSLVVVEDLVVKYAPELPSVLRGISFALKGRERVGLLGRTGSGKSTLAMSILRFVDPTSGRILIDGIDISKIGIHDLRSRLTFIPQDATLFSGTIRDNLDPFNEYNDEECINVLRRVQMITSSTGSSKDASRIGSREPSIHESATTSAPVTTGIETHQAETYSESSSALTEMESRVTITLDTQVSAGGTNFSQGQRQLIAMARALLRRSSIIVLDEATSSIDFATDAKIQKTIREEFTNSLLLTVAHRLRTVIDYDRLIVLDKGEVVEFDTPVSLIKKEDGVFRNMCLKSGTFAELEAAAEAAGQGVS